MIVLKAVPEEFAMITSLSLLTASVQSGNGTAAAGVAMTQSQPSDVETLLTLYDAKVSRDKAEHEERMEQVEQMRRGAKRDETAARRIARLQEKTAEYRAALNKLLEGQEQGSSTVLFAVAKGKGGVAVAVKAERVALETGAGNDAVTVQAQRVGSVYTGAGMDAVSISAKEVNSLYTGQGADAVAINSTIVKSVYTGQGDDAIAVQAGIAGGIYGGQGADVITVDAGLGNSVAWMLTGTEGGTASERAAMLTGDVATRYRAVQTNIADVNGGQGNDVISVSGAEAISVAGEAGDDLISVSGRTIGLHYGVGDGHDVVQIAAGTDVLLQLGARPDGSSAPKDYIVSREGDVMRLDFGSGSITFTGMLEAGSVAVLPTGRGEPVYLHSGAVDVTA